MRTHAGFIIPLGREMKLSAAPALHTLHLCLPADDRLSAPPLTSSVPPIMTLPVMTLPEDLTSEIPPVSITRLEDDPAGSELLERLDGIHERKEQAQATIRAEGKPLSDLMAEADEVAARALVGDADEEEVEAAEAAVQEAKDNIEAARREVRQCERAADLVRDKLRERSAELHRENADSVRAVHRVLLRRALEAEREAAALLRFLREFEARYARYTADDQSVQHPQYLKEHERTQPPRALMGPARTPGGNVFSRTEATTWMYRAADMLDEEPPAVLHLESLDFEAEATDLQYRRLDEDELPSALAPAAAPDASAESLEETAPAETASNGTGTDADGESDPAGETEEDASETDADATSQTEEDPSSRA